MSGGLGGMSEAMLFVGGGKAENFGNHAPCGRGKTVSSNEPAIYGHMSSGKGKVSETVSPLWWNKTGSS